MYQPEIEPGIPRLIARHTDHYTTGPYAVTYYPIVLSAYLYQWDHRGEGWKGKEGVLLTAESTPLGLQESNKGRSHQARRESTISYLCIRVFQLLGQNEEKRLNGGRLEGGSNLKPRRSNGPNTWAINDSTI
uniref:Uncharacterized protein n=1 Tax=Timema cristinae TaxID=61476 RepID=A0A7R9CKJ2_TIMCR|nr:unnamed protein product [Timema cristinae]